jgi:hypothetical protein
MPVIPVLSIDMQPAAFLKFIVAVAGVALFVVKCRTVAVRQLNYIC